MISVIYTILLTLLIIWLSFNVIKIRRKNQISIGDGNDMQLKTAMAAQSNALEYIPIALLLMYPLEYNGAFPLIIHIFGLLLIAGRVIHAKGLLSENIDLRVLSMQITIWVIIGLVITNMIVFPYSKMITLW